VVIKAFFAASDAAFFSNQNPISKYDPNPTSSQQKYRKSKLSARTKASIAPANKAWTAKYHEILGSPDMYPTEYIWTSKDMNVTNPSITMAISSIENPKVMDKSSMTIQSMLTLDGLNPVEMKSTNIKQKKINPNRAAAMGRKIPLYGRFLPNKLVMQKAITANPGIIHAYSALKIIVQILAL
jgi:hypothetical protein